MIYLDPRAYISETQPSFPRLSNLLHPSTRTKAHHLNFESFIQLWKVSRPKDMCNF